MMYFSNKFAKAKRFYLLAFAFILVFMGKAQYNLVPNYSFEDYVICPYFSIGSDNAAPPLGIRTVLSI
jgi:hypothetical protein